MRAILWVTYRVPLALVAVLSFIGCVGTVSPAGLRPTGTGEFVEATTGRPVTLDSVAALASHADVLLFGEVHDDSIAHRVQLDLAQRLAARGVSVIVGLEMFGRDVQALLDDPRSGGPPSADFLERSRAWTNYATDYAPLVEFARSKGWRVIGTNLPQAHAALIAREGISALESLPPEQRSYTAAEHLCPRDAYWRRFVAELTEESDSAAHAGIGADDPQMVRMFEAQCARDEAMAEVIARAAVGGTLIYHLNGRFHSDYKLGIVPRLARRRPDVRVLTLSVVSLEDYSRDGLSEYRDAADFLLITSPD